MSPPDDYPKTPQPSPAFDLDGGVGVGEGDISGRPLGFSRFRIGSCLLVSGELCASLIQFERSGSDNVRHFSGTSDGPFFAGVWANAAVDAIASTTVANAVLLTLCIDYLQ